MLRMMCPRALRLRREYCSMSIQGNSKDSLIQLDNLSQDNFLAPLSLFNNQKLQKPMFRKEKEKEIDNIGTFDFSNLTVSEQYQTMISIEEPQHNNNYIHQNILKSADSEGSKVPNKNPEQDKKAASDKDQNDESDSEDESEEESDNDDDNFGMKIPLFDLFFNRP